MSDTIEKLEEAIRLQAESTAALAVAEYEKTIELKRQNDELERTRLARETHTKRLEELIEKIDNFINKFEIFLTKRHFENIEQLLEIIIPILSQVGTTLNIRKSELDRLERLAKQGINITPSSTNIGQIDNYGETNVNN